MHIQSSDSGSARTLPGEGSRIVVLHYHLFKNAGTSIDRGLKLVFGTNWDTIEAGPGKGILPTERLQALIDERPALQAISSHTATIDPWSIRGVRVLPILFLRHPIDRMRSAYDFERKQKANTLGAQKAKELDFRAYAEFFLNHPKSMVFRNFQARRLAAGCKIRAEGLLERAQNVVRCLPVLGVVERFDESVGRFIGLAATHDIELAFPSGKRNSGPRQGSLEERIDAIRVELGEALYRFAVQENAEDFAIWETALASYGASPPARLAG